MTREYREAFEFGISKKGENTPLKEKVISENGIEFIHSSDEANSDYYTLLFNDSIVDDKMLYSYLEKALADIINKFKRKYKIKRKSFVLTVGIGNEEITADSLGQKVCKKIVATKHLSDAKHLSYGYGVLASYMPGVAGVSGLDSSQLIKAVCDAQKPDLVIVVDTIAARDYKKLNRCIQISDDGITAGGGVANDKTKLDKTYLGVPVIAIGVPLVMYISRIISAVFPEHINALPDDLKTWVVSTKEIDFEVSFFGMLIAESINKSVHKR